MQEEVYCQLCLRGVAGVPFVLADIKPDEAAAGVEELHLPKEILHQVCVLTHMF